ncbi:acyl carrier protein [compost metagenome]
MYTNEIVSSIHSIINNVLEQEVKINMEDELEKAGFDSIKIMNLIVQIEESFDIVFDDEELVFEYFSNIKKINDLIQAKLAALK